MSGPSDKKADEIQDFEIGELPNVTAFKPTNVYMIKKKYFYIITIILCVLFAGSILATYFGKPGKYYFRNHILSTDIPGKYYEKYQ